MSAESAPDTISVKDAFRLMADYKFKAAVAMCDDILEQMPRNATAICIRERCRWRSGVDPADCVQNLQAAQEIAPDSALVLNYRVEILVSSGQLEEARKVLEHALELDPQNLRSFRELTEITRYSEETPLVLRMKEVYAAGDLRAGPLATLGFALAKVYSDLKQADVAMKYANAANAAAKREFDVATVHDRRADLEKLAATSTTRTSEQKSDQTGPGPIFIVGMPRSGTTLVETITSRHPDVYAAGEMNVLPGIERHVTKWLREYRGISAGPNTMLEHVPENVWRQNADRVEEIVRQRADQDFRRFTDKLPDNARRLPLISKLFPDARIVYVRRHPLDCGLSNYLKQFAQINYSFQQEWLGLYYRDLTETVAISRKLISAPVLDLSYEKLVADPETETRRLVDFVGLDWDEGFLSPEKSDRKTVMTASRWQVRQPIYRDSAARWKPYEPYLAEMIAAMGGMEWIEAEVAATAQAASA